MADGKARPGVMIYFESVRPALSRLDNEQCGALFRAIIDYAEYGAVPDLEPMTGMAFDLLRPKIDRDAEKYEESREQRQHAVSIRPGMAGNRRPIEDGRGPAQRQGPAASRKDLRGGKRNHTGYTCAEIRKAAGFEYRPSVAGCDPGKRDRGPGRAIHF